MSTELSRKLRQQSSPPERAMWRILRQFRREGYHFRRQLLIGTYYADFACRQPALVIEVDGDTHGSDLAQANDATRDDYFRSRGFQVLRFWNIDVIRNAEGVYLTIEATLSALSPPPRGEGSAARAVSARSEARVGGAARSMLDATSSQISPPTPAPLGLRPSFATLPARGREKT